MKQIITILDVIKETYPDKSFTCIGDDFSTIDWGDAKKLKEADVRARVTELQKEVDAAYEQKETDASSGNQKLLDLGLTQAEATALTGYKPGE
tara:strand:+ start:514 stop:792 length:279 start_codon:yes stop_codon:yes gene_type:complete